MEAMLVAEQEQSGAGQASGRYEACKAGGAMRPSLAPTRSAATPARGGRRQRLMTTASVRFVPPVGVFALGKKITIIVYHSVCRQGDRFAISPAAFRRQIDYIRNSYSIIRLGGIKEGLQESGDSGRRVVITFDDAYTDFHDW